MLYCTVSNLQPLTTYNEKRVFSGMLALFAQILALPVKMKKRTMKISDCFAICRMLWEFRQACDCFYRKIIFSLVWFWTNHDLRRCKVRSLTAMFSVAIYFLLQTSDFRLSGKSNNTISTSFMIKPKTFNLCWIVS